MKKLLPLIIFVAIWLVFLCARADGQLRTTNNVVFEDKTSQYTLEIYQRAATPFWFYTFDSGTNIFNPSGFGAIYYWSTNQATSDDDVSKATLMSIAGTTTASYVVFTPGTNNFTNALDGMYSTLVLTNKTTGARHTFARGTHTTIRAPEND